MNDDPWPQWRHKKRGSVVTEIGRGKMQISNVPLYDMGDVVIYRHDQDGTLWVRSVDEFEDGRFERLPSDTES